MATVDNTVTPIISVIRWRILTIGYGVIRLVALCFLVMLIWQYIITENCYKAFLLLSTSKLFQGTPLTFNYTYFLIILKLKCIITRVYIQLSVFLLFTFLFGYTHFELYKVKTITWNIINMVFKRNFYIKIFLR
jgi:hypothetical protein